MGRDRQRVQFCGDARCIHDYAQRPLALALAMAAGVYEADVYD